MGNPFFEFLVITYISKTTFAGNGSAIKETKVGTSEYIFHSSVLIY
jgi:hypothetical protein